MQHHDGTWRRFYDYGDQEQGEVTVALMDDLLTKHEEDYPEGDAAAEKVFCVLVLAAREQIRRIYEAGEMLHH